jgi:hypothetical protein
VLLAAQPSPLSLGCPNPEFNWRALGGPAGQPIKGESVI